MPSNYDDRSPPSPEQQEQLTTSTKFVQPQMQRRDSSSSSNRAIDSTSIEHQSLINSGQLIDCDYVSSTVRNHLLVQHEQQQQSSMNPKCFIMDGYPRTIRQIELMNQQWITPKSIISLDASTTSISKTAKYEGHHNSSHSTNHHVLDITIPVAFHINVPEQVCIEKIHGRRICSKCSQEWNISYVRYHHNDNDFDLPPTLPNNVMSLEEVTCCQPSIDWYQRMDDIHVDIIRRRIHTYYENIQPILHYYQSNHNLIQFTPYRGKKDLKNLLLHIQNWFALRL